MTDDVPVLVWLPPAVEPEVVAALDATDGVRLARRCADLAEVLGAARAGVAGLVVLALGRGVDRARLHDIARLGVRIVLVVPRASSASAAALGADAVVPEGGDLAAALADAVTRVLTSEPGTPEGERAASPAPAPASERGAVIAVWSGPGAPGRSTVAAALAGEFAALGEATFLVDADVAAPSQSQALALAEETSAIAALCRVAGQGDLSPQELERRCATLPGGVWFVSGLTRADRWREAPPEHLRVVMEACRAQAPWTVVDVAGGWEAAPTRGIDRFGATRCVLEVADLVLVVIAADPVGVRRGVVALGDLAEALPGGARRVLLNASRPLGATGMESAAQALERFAGRSPDWRIPYDAAIAAAMLAGRGLAQSAPRSPARRAFSRAARDLTQAREPAQAGRRRARRLRG